jgi:PiT family inorganic phosphate transporter
MITETSLLIGIVLASGFYMAWNIGANDVANAMGTSIGSKALSWRQAVGIAAVLEFLGALLVGGNVTATIQSGIVDPEVFARSPQIFVLGMLSALIGSGLWLNVASLFGWPVSTTHAIVGSILGFGLIVGGPGAILWLDTAAIAISWIISPVLAGLVAYGLFSAVQRLVLYDPHPVRAARRFAPWIVGFALTILSLCVLFEGLKNLHLNFSFAGALSVGLFIGLIGLFITRIAVRRMDLDHPIVEGKYTPGHLYLVEKATRSLHRLGLSPADPLMLEVNGLLASLQNVGEEMARGLPQSHEPSPYEKVERIFSWLQIMSACFVAFAHGANDVANAIGPVAACLQTIRYGTLGAEAPVPVWLLAAGGFAIVIGLATWGWKVVHTVGQRITELTPTRGFSAEFGAALTILVASKLGMPISTTHALIGAVIGVGMARGLHALNLRTVRDIVSSWIATIPAAAAAGVGVFFALNLLLQMAG